MSPGPNSCAGMCSLPCWKSSEPMRSFACVRASTSVWSGLTEPCSTRKRLIRPANGSAIVLKTNAAVSAPSMWVIEPAFAGDGTPSTIRSSSACAAEVLRRDAAGDREDLAARDRVLERVRDLFDAELLAVEVALHQALVGLDDLVEQLLAVLLHLRRPARPESAPARAPSRPRGSCRRTCGARRRFRSARARRRSGAERRRSVARAAPGAARARGRSRRAHDRAC